MSDIYSNKEVTIKVTCHTSFCSDYILGESYTMKTEPRGSSKDTNYEEFISCWISQKNPGFGGRFAIKGNVYKVGDGGKPYWPKFLDYFYDPIVFERDKKLQQIIK